MRKCEHLSPQSELNDASVHTAYRTKLNAHLLKFMPIAEIGCTFANLKIAIINAILSKLCIKEYEFSKYEFV